VAAMAWLGCSDDPVARPASVDAGSGVACKDNPLGCPKGETCWFANQGSTEFKCFRSGDAGVGAACDARQGAPSCQDGMLCLSVSDGRTTASPTCVAYCDADAAAPDTCGAGLTCQVPNFASLTRLPVCLAGVKDAGSDR
jgi:hypothetical protein